MSSHEVLCFLLLSHVSPMCRSPQSDLQFPSCAALGRYKDCSLGSHPDCPTRQKYTAVHDVVVLGQVSER